MIERALLEQALPAYEIGDELGRGGFGVVIAGRHRRLGRDVAIKQLPRAFGADPEVSRRFLAEAQVLARLEHPHIVPVFDYVEHEGLCVLVMENMSGGTLWNRLQSGQVGAQLACATTLAVLAALDRAHDEGVLHRDIKPDNVLFGETGTVKVVDFGIAKVIGDHATRGATRTGEILGTPTYMAPEQARGEELTVAADLYAVAVLLYELFAGRPPFESAGDPLSVLYQHLHEPPPPLPATVPTAIAAVVAKGLEKKPADRCADAEDMAVALARACTATWGPDWTEVAGVELVAPARVLRSLIERPAAAAGATRIAGPASVAGAAVVAPAPPLPSVEIDLPDAGRPAGSDAVGGPQPVPVAGSVAVDLETAVDALVERLGASSYASLVGADDDELVVVLGRPGLPLPAALQRIAGDPATAVPGIGATVELDGGACGVWAAPLPSAGAQPAVIGEALAVMACPAVVMVDATGLGTGDRALLSLVSARSPVRPLVLNEDLGLAVAPDVTALGREVTGGRDLPQERRRVSTLLTLLYAERRLTLRLLQEDQPLEELRRFGADLLAADRAETEEAVAAAFREAVALSVSALATTAASMASGFETAALRGVESLEAIDIAIGALVRLAGELTNSWGAAEAGVADLVERRVPRLARLVAGVEPSAVATAAVGIAAPADNGHAARPAMALASLAASLEALRARLVAAAATVRESEPDLAEAAAADAARRLLSSAASLPAEVDLVRRTIDAWAAQRVDAVRRGLDRVDAGMVSVFDAAVSRAVSVSVPEERRNVALDALADLDEIESLLARAEAEGR